MGGKGSGGHNRKTIEQHLKNGTYRASRHGPIPKRLTAKQQHKHTKIKTKKDTVLVSAKIYTPIPAPAYFDEYARKEWERVCKVLYDLGTLQDVNHATLEGYCSAYSTAVKSTKKINDDGFSSEKPLFNKQGDMIGSIEIKRPEVDISIKAWQQVKMFAVELGITTSRVKIEDTGEGLTPLEKMIREAEHKPR
jgi:P27 family predicted phage terminase small subunit